MGRFALCLIAALLAGCSGLSRMETPRPDKLAPYPFERAKSSSFSLAGVVASFKRGEVVFHQPASFPSAEGRERKCNPEARQYRVEWDEGRKYLGDWQSEAGAVFYEVMKESGMRVGGDPDAVFTGGEKKESARLRVAANVKRSRGNVCTAYDEGYFDERPVFAGELAVDVAWTLYDPIEKKVVREFSTSGYGRVYGVESSNGPQVVFLRAFGEAAQNLANSSEFVEALLESYRGKRTREPTIDGQLTVVGVPNWHDGIDTKILKLIRGTVVVKQGVGHGSGFVVSKDGYVLTARHVVGDAEDVTVEFDNGVEVPAKVVRASVKRDAALLKIAVGGLTPIPIDAKRTLQPSAEVFALGAPLREALRSTLTRGIVSAVRVDDRGMNEIQSDVDIQPGNSGGPLLDGNGNVVGVAVSGMLDDKTSIGINFFAPIGQVLEVLKIDLAAEDSTR